VAMVGSNHVRVSGRQQCELGRRVLSGIAWAVIDDFDTRRMSQIAHEQRRSRRTGGMQASTNHTLAYNMCITAAVKGLPGLDIVQCYL